ncbi:MAG: lipid-A-disaccharide synthase [Planctomycetia bacterium]|nr:lipid-A-disaccharide synthase [Planctomycetia bacterium]
MRIFFSVGEPSGDLHGANLIRALRQRRPDVECMGYGGPLMAEAGCALHRDLTALAVMWLLRVLLNLHKFLDLVSKADRFFRHQRPDAVVLIDYPGFNWWIARRAKAHGIPVFYYTPPQIWGWASWRVAKMRRFVDHVLCSLPFEEKWFRDRGCHAEFIGHPYFDEVRRQRFDQEFLDGLAAAGTGPLVTILPGSRTQEVEQNLPTFLRAAQEIRRRVPNVRFAVAAFRPHQAEWARELVAKLQMDVKVFVGRTPELIRAATCCLACSGSVSLELLYHRKPTVIGYRVARFGYLVQNFFRQVPYITLVNLLATGRLERDRAAEGRGESPLDDPRVLFPEFLSAEDRSPEMGTQVVEWLTNEAVRERTIGRLARLCDEVGGGGASARGADYIVNVLEPSPTPIARPHYLRASVGKATITRRSN